MTQERRKKSVSGALFGLLQLQVTGAQPTENPGRMCLRVHLLFPLLVEVVTRGLISLYFWVVLKTGWSSVASEKPQRQNG